jgi:Mycobacterium 19 kDa lipoprotein antigen
MRSAGLSATGRVPFGVAALLLVPLLTCSCNDEPGSVTTVVFDGTTQTITGHVACTSQPDGKLVILVNEDGGKKTIRVLLSARGRLVVEKAALRYLDHSGYVADPHEVEATKVDDTYKFSGRMPPNAGESQWHLFEIEATCPFVKDAPPPSLDAPIGAP